MKHHPQEHTGRAVGLAVAFFGALAAIGWLEGVFERLGGGTAAALALFAAAFAVATVLLDGDVRGWAAGRARALGARFRKAPAKSPARRPAAT